MATVFTPEEIWIKIFLARHPDWSRQQAIQWIQQQKADNGRFKDGEILLRYHGPFPYPQTQNKFYVIVQEFIYQQQSESTNSEPQRPTGEAGQPSELSGELIPSVPGRLTFLLPPQEQTITIKDAADWVRYRVLASEGENRNGVILSSPHTRNSPSLPTRVWRNTLYPIVQVQRQNGGIQIYGIGKEIPLFVGDIVSIPLFYPSRSNGSATSNQESEGSSVRQSSPPTTAPRTGTQQIPSSTFDATPRPVTTTANPSQSTGLSHQERVLYRNAQEDAKELREALDKSIGQSLRRVLNQLPGEVHTIMRILNQPPLVVRKILEVYNSNYNTLSRQGLFVDLKQKLDILDLGERRNWEFVVAQFKRAGISIPAEILQDKKLEKLEYVRQNQKGNYNTDFQIVAKPETAVVVPGTKITYQVKLRAEVFDKRPNYQYQWYILNDPETVKKDPNVPARYDHYNVGSLWEDAEWKVPGNHKVICRVQIDDRPPQYIEYQQTVLPSAVVLNDAFNKAKQPPDPSRQAEILKTYQTILLNAEQQEGSNPLDPKEKQQLQDYIDGFNKNLKSTEGRKRYPIKAVYLSTEDAITAPLNIFVAKTKEQIGSPWAGKETWNLVDITHPGDRHRRMSGEYEGRGETAQEAIITAINEWDTQNRYYPGLIQLEIPEEVAGQSIHKEFQTDSKSLWDSVSEFLDAIGLVAGIGAIVTAAFPVVSVPLAAISLVSTSAGASIRIAQRRVEGQPFNQEDALDILAIAGNIAGGAWLLKSRALIRGSGSFSNGVLIAQIGTDGVSGILLNSTFLERYEEIKKIKDPKERTDKLIELLQQAVLTNGLLLVSIKGEVDELVGNALRSGSPIEITTSQTQPPETSGIPPQEAPTSTSATTHPPTQEPTSATTHPPTQEVPNNRPAPIDTVDNAVSRLRNSYPNHTFEVDGEFILINNRIKIEPEELSKLLKDEKLPDLLRVSQVLNEVNGNYRDLNPEIQNTLRTSLVDFNTKRRELSEPELRAYMAEVDNDWKSLQKKILGEANNMQLMLQFTKYRKDVLTRYEEIIKQRFNNLVEGQLIEKDGGAFKSVIAGSDQPTSDYDATFVSPTGDKRVEMEAVIEFNLRFRQEFGKESGTVFDTNVYTTGHTLPSSMGDRLNEVMAMRKLEELLNLPKDLADAKDELTKLEGRAYNEQADKIKKMEAILPEREQRIREKVDEINQLRRANPNNSEPELPVGSIDDLDVGKIGEQKGSVERGLREQVSNEKHRNRTSEQAQPQLAADRDVMALLKQRRYMTDDEWLGVTNEAGERVGGYRDRMLASTDESLKAATRARLDKADEIYKRATQELHEKIVELNRNKPSGEQVLDINGSPETDAAKIMKANGDAQLEAFNRLYEHYLREAQDIRDLLENYRAMRSGENPSTLPEEQLNSEIDRLTIELNEMQSKALFFANEAYHTGPAVEHVVLGQQLELNIPLEIDEYLVSINEQVGFAMEQVTADKSLGKALWKSAKYMDRVNNAIAQIKRKDGSLFDSVAQAKNDKMKDLFNELILIKKEKGKYYQMSDEEKSVAAIEVAESKGFNFGSAENLRQELLKFSIEINTKIRNAKSSQYNTDPSSLNNWPAARPNQNSSQTFSGQSEKLAQSPAKNLELAEFG